MKEQYCTRCENVAIQEDDSSCEYCGHELVPLRYMEGFKSDAEIMAAENSR